MSTTASDRAAWLKGPSCRCSTAPARVDRPWRLVLLGAPGAGKGTQAELLHKNLGACQLSTGDVFRAAKGLPENQLSPAMSSALGQMKRGELVDDATVLNMIRERKGCLSCKGGFLLDGFPRTVAQAEALEGLLAELNTPLDAVISYEIPIDEVIARMEGRRTCPGCKAVYHTVAHPPKVEGVCDQCGGKLIQREDDRAEAVRVRMQAYEQSTMPLAKFYRDRNLLVPVRATGNPDDIYRTTMILLRTRE